MPRSASSPSGGHRRGRRRWLALLLFCILVGLAVAVWTALPALDAARDARAQVTALETAGARLRREVPSPAGLAAFDGHLLRLSGDLRTVRQTWGTWRGPALLIGGLVPHLGAQLRQIDPLLDYGDALTQAGHLLSRALAPVLSPGKGGAVAAASPAIVAQLVAARPALHGAAGLLAQAASARRRIVPEDLPASLRPGLRTLDALLPRAPDLFRTLAALPAALGADGPRDYLVVPQNSLDLRASGGFIRTVGILRVAHGRVQLIHMEDAYSIDAGRRANVDAPLPIGVHGWGAWYFRDANWSADFPTTARLLEVFYQLNTHRAVQGVVAFDSRLLPQLFGLTGPVAVPGYPETLTARNAFQRIDYYFNVAASRYQKALPFATAAYKATFSRLLALPRQKAPQALTVARAAIRAHDVLVYANDPAVEEAVRLAQADGAINRTTGDYLYVVDTNMSTNKINNLVRCQIAYRALLQPDRAILATLTLTYTNNADRNNVPPQYGQPAYSDFVRVVVPAGSFLFSTSGLSENWPVYTLHGKTQFSGYFELPSLQARTITFRYRVPGTVAAGPAYNLLIQKQPGAAAPALVVDVEATAGLRLDPSPLHRVTALAADVSVSAPLSGGTPPPPAPPPAVEPPIVPGAQPEPWVTVPSGTVPAPNDPSFSRP